jgi:6-pyruvoyltetrahydropterin/6-carboxytetrahydropterin synthase
MPYAISKEIEFDAGHRVPNHDSKCKNPHGHRYKVQVEVFAHDVIREEGHPSEGMLADFSFLKQALTECIHDPLDHSFIVWLHDDELRGLFDLSHEDWKIVFFPYIPTAENLARWSFEQLASWFNLNSEDIHGFQLHNVTVWETPTSVATYWNGVR